MKNIFLIGICLLNLGCTTYIDPLYEESKMNINLNNYQGNFIILDKVIEVSNFYRINYYKPSITINESDKGFLNVDGKTIFISQSIPVKNISFALGIYPTTVHIKNDDKGNGLAISAFIENEKSSISATTFESYKPKSIINQIYTNNFFEVIKSNIIDETVRIGDRHNSFNNLSSFKLDEKGNGLLSYSYSNYKSRNGTLLDNYNFAGQGKILVENKTNQMEIRNFKFVKETKKSTGLTDAVQLIKKENDKFSVIGIPINFENYGELTNTPFIDDNGNGTITWYETFSSNPSPYFKIFTQKIENYKAVGERIELLTLNKISVDCKINSQGRGIIVYLDSDKKDGDISIRGKLYFSEIKGFKLGEKIELSNSEKSINGTVGINSKGNGLIAWQDENKIYGRRLKDYQLQ